MELDTEETITIIHSVWARGLWHMDIGGEWRGGSFMKTLTYTNNCLEEVKSLCQLMFMILILYIIWLVTAMVTLRLFVQYVLLIVDNTYRMYKILTRLYEYSSKLLSVHNTHNKYHILITKYGTRITCRTLVTTS